MVPLAIAGSAGPDRRAGSVRRLPRAQRDIWSMGLDVWTVPIRVIYGLAQQTSTIHR